MAAFERVARADIMRASAAGPAGGSPARSVVGGGGGVDYLPYTGPRKKDGSPDKRTVEYRQWLQERAARASEQDRAAD